MTVESTSSARAVYVRSNGSHALKLLKSALSARHDNQGGTFQSSVAPNVAAVGRLGYVQECKHIRLTFNKADFKSTTHQGSFHEYHYHKDFLGEISSF